MSERRWRAQRVSQTLYRVGRGALPALRRELDPLPDRVPIITDPRVWRLYGSAVEEVLGPAKPLVLFVDGEREKQLETVERTILELAANRVHRREKLVILGGGVCSDVGGMVALLYMRGMSYTIVATTLMAQIDAAIGGKVGCNAAARKNLLGGFHHPDLVLIDPGFLETLSPRHLRAALAEALKLAILLPDLGIGPLLTAARDGDNAATTLLLERCLEGKLSLLDDDPFESDLRRELNLGHAVAHALEMVPGCPMLHGEAVAVGLAATARYAEYQGTCTPERAEGIVTQLEQLQLPTSIPVKEHRLRSCLEEIADHRGGSMRLVIPAGSSDIEIHDDCDLDLLIDCVQGLPVTH